jgi:photosystem II stability/assembly factor-like uncharacterized protein
MMRTSIISMLMIVLPFLSAGAQAPVSGYKTKQNTESVVPGKAYQGMRWRFVGPYRAGWATVAVGVPGKPNTFYFGAAGGGVWKTNNAGRTWEGLMQHKTASAIGALDVALSNPDIIYAGTGQVTTRYDNMAGNGVYRSADGGKTWTNVGLKDTRHIGRILIDPKDPNRVLVAALGHVYDTNKQRGVFLTTDGGKHWKQVLYENDKSGAVDLAWDPEHPSVVYAALWQMRIHPWLDYFQPKIGPGSGIYKSTDGGEHWTRLSGHGLPESDLGRIGIGVARGSNGQRVYATVIAKNGKNGLYRSDNGGQSWKLINNNGALANSYFSRVTVSPKNPDEVYVMGRSIRRSMDGGRTFKIVKGAPGGDDYHFLWINPNDPTHMITGADQGAAVTVDGGKYWSSWYNQPTGQFYHIALDNQFPYHIYSGQQDNGTVEIANRGPYGVIEERDWHPVGGDERDYMVPKPGNPDMVFGSGLGGHISRFDEVTRQVANVSPWPISSYGAYPPGVKYRYTWITPLEFSKLGSHPMYFGSQYLFKSTDNGDHWDIISPDLTGKKEDHKLKNPTLDQAKDNGFGVIYTIAPSPIKENEIWIGTDDGLIQLTTDGGKTWHNVTPPSIPAWGRIDAISPSHFDTKTAYVAVDLHRIGKFKPMILKTTDSGKHWLSIDNGLPMNQYSTVVRADPIQKGLLFSGTDRSVYVSFNDGANWEPLTMNFPTTWVRDLKIHDGDLVAGTQGRGFWVMDDLEPLRELAANSRVNSNYLFKPAVAVRLRGDENKDTPPPPSTPLGQNPPAGAVIDYYLNGSAQGPVTITIKDTEGNLVRKYSSANQNENLPAFRYFQKGWLGSPEHISAKPGMHRFVWDLRYTRPQALHYDYSIAGVWEDHTPVNPEGALVLPGTYKVTLTVAGKSYTEPVMVKLDPRVQVSNNALKSQLAFAQLINERLNTAVETYKEIEEILSEKQSNLPSSTVSQLKDIADRGESNLSSVSGILAMLSTKVEGADAAPNQGQHDVFNQYNKELVQLLQQWRHVKSSLK